MATHLWNMASFGCAARPFSASWCGDQRRGSERPHLQALGEERLALLLRLQLGLVEVGAHEAPQELLVVRRLLQRLLEHVKDLPLGVSECEHVNLI